MHGSPRLVFLVWGNLYQIHVRGPVESETSIASAESCRQVLEGCVWECGPSSRKATRDSFITVSWQSTAQTIAYQGGLSDIGYLNNAETMSNLSDESESLQSKQQLVGV